MHEIVFPLVLFSGKDAAQYHRLAFLVLINYLMMETKILVLLIIFIQILARTLKSLHVLW